ncbi:hypothetical protein X769_09685 [Mesorhizobium sp. LSJC268A00]|nr:hypothetical protein X771_13595 [Mesorhizobium sp. LSJC277A00]ESX03983.1 hypothetical protein X768_29765 [Mesorhizobium sp. LSJC265A00]ESX07287.1 hypothetical protein X769_09685 [Mesorhizobium sp. LSJC268A00]ESX23888.1 hypothetical protein X767_13480 [Mesorhizobium sp. LSJC264A00]ESX32849.1 hypothetical protein X765_03100 [Mesorhizobium sp. LSHC440B00]ESX40084.1 hypothetical protein X763_05320 [Mesorhizobium sp. LSHC432A00]ESX55702.1 hypothetical protein X761_14205 [Mesorhizobium sp. LSHC4
MKKTVRPADPTDPAGARRILNCWTMMTQAWKGG